MIVQSEEEIEAGFTAFELNVFHTTVYINAQKRTRRPWENAIGVA